MSNYVNIFRVQVSDVARIVFRDQSIQTLSQSAVATPVQGPEVVMTIANLRELSSLIDNCLRRFDEESVDSVSATNHV